MTTAVTSALVLFDVDLPACEEVRQVRLFIDGTYQETRPLLPGERLIAGMHAPLGAMVRLELLNSQLARVATASFTAPNERKVVPAAGLTVRILGELFACASAAGT